MGVHGQNLFIDPEAGLVIAKLSSQTGFFDYGAAVMTHKALRKLRAMLA